MSDFIEQLKSVGGVKPCCCIGVEPVGDYAPAVCCLCHGTGQILDLAPLLAKPKELMYIVQQLVFKKWMEDESMTFNDLKSFAVVGPQRAYSLVYEVARQLGGTAVVAEPEFVPFDFKRMLQPIELRSSDADDEVWNRVREAGASVVKSSGKYRLSLPIPPDATVLFVTDRFDMGEMQQVTGCMKERKLLPYILCLVSGASELLVEGTEPWIQGSNNFKVISLHQEKP
jgi:hypothetical protein